MREREREYLCFIYVIIIYYYFFLIERTPCCRICTTASTIKAIFLLRCLIKKNIEMPIKIFMIFIDLEMAYDTLESLCGEFGREKS